MKPQNSNSTFIFEKDHSHSKKMILVRRKIAALLNKKSFSLNVLTHKNQILVIQDELVKKTVSLNQTKQLS